MIDSRAVIHETAVIADDVYPILSLESTLAKRQALGGVCAEQIAHALQQAEQHLAARLF